MRNWATPVFPYLAWAWLSGSDQSFIPARFFIWQGITNKEIIMKNILTLVCLTVLVLTSCKKSTSVKPNITTNGTSDYVKTQTQLTSATASDPYYDSISFNYYYDTQNRLDKVTFWQWDNGSGTITTDSILTLYSYSPNTVTMQLFYNGSSSPSTQSIYYVNSTTSLNDSTISQSFANNAWVTTERDVYTYDANGYASMEVATQYNSQSGSVTGVVVHYYSWSNGDMISDSTAASVTTFTYYNNSSKLNTGNGLTGPAFKGLTSADIQKTETITGGLFTFLFNITYTPDNNNRLSTLTLDGFSNGSEISYYRDFFTYY